MFSANQITFRHSILYTDYPGVHFAALRWTLHVEESDKRRSILLLYKIESYFLRPWHYYDVDADFTVILFRTRIVLGGCRMLGGQIHGLMSANRSNSWFYCVVSVTIVVFTTMWVFVNFRQTSLTNQIRCIKCVNMFFNPQTRLLCSFILFSLWDILLGIHKRWLITF